MKVSVPNVLHISELPSFLVHLLMALLYPV